MRIIVIGTVQFSLKMLQLLHQQGEVVGVITGASAEAISDYVDMTPFCEEWGIPFLQTTDINSADSVNWVRERGADIIFCLGWSRLVKADLLRSSPMGVVGYHPAALPKNRGRHPLIWALVLGLKETASTFFFMDEGADSGDILSQERIAISDQDDATSLYNKMVEVAKAQLATLLRQLQKDTYSRIPQSYELSNSWRKRGVKDGEVDWRMSAQSIHNLVRGLAAPYVGAHFVYQGGSYIVWKSSIVPCEDKLNIEPGKVLQVSENRLIIKCGEGCIELLDVKPLPSLKVGTYL